MAVHFVARTSDIPAGTHKIVDVQGRSIGVYNIKGEYYAIMNLCPHERAELCKGPVCGTNVESNVFEYVYGRDQELVRCPWHGWEFDIKTGTSLFSAKVRTRTYQVEVHEGQVGILM